MQNLTKKEKNHLAWILKSYLDARSNYKEFYKEEIKIAKSIIKKITN